MERSSGEQMLHPVEELLLRERLGKYCIWLRPCNTFDRHAVRDTRNVKDFRRRPLYANLVRQIQSVDSGHFYFDYGQGDFSVVAKHCGYAFHASARLQNKEVRLDKRRADELSCVLIGVDDENG